MSIRFASRELVPFIGHFVVLDALVAWAPPDLDPDAGRVAPILFFLFLHLLHATYLDHGDIHK